MPRNKTFLFILSEKLFHKINLVNLKYIHTNRLIYHFDQFIHSDTSTSNEMLLRSKYFDSRNFSLTLIEEKYY